MPQAQNLILTGKVMADFLNASCASDSSLNYGKAWAAWPSETNADAMPRFWQDALNKGKSSALPAIVIANERGEFLHVGALPSDTAATQALIRKYLPKQKKAG